MATSSRDDKQLDPDVGIVIPTLGLRPEYLKESITSVRGAGDAVIAIVRPRDAQIDDSVLELADQVADDSGRGLAAAINTGIRSLPTSVRYVSWLGDDDRLTPGSLPLVAEELRNSHSAAVYGQCRYIDAHGRALWLNRNGRWAAALMMFGPQLVPQPGSLVRRSDFDAIGGLNESRKWAFDLEMFLQLRHRGDGLRYFPQPVAEFRWHDGSLSVGSRSGSVTEASAIRRQYLPVPLRKVSALWEPALRRLILWAGVRMNRRLESSD